MSWLGTFLRQCPSCGHRLHVRLVNERLLNDKRAAEPVGREEAVTIETGGSAMGTRLWGKVHSPPMGPQEKETFTTETREFEDTYKCGRCGHQWSEKHAEDEAMTG